MKSIVISVWVFAASLALSCQQPELVEVGKAMTFKLDVFITDTSVFQSVLLDNRILAENTNVINGTYANLVNADNGIAKPKETKVILEARIIKRSNPNLLFREKVSVYNINDYLLFQVNPLSEARLINKLTAADHLTPPGKDSVKLRFFFNDGDRIVNPLNNNSKVTMVNLQVYRETFKPNGQVLLVKDTLFTGIKINELSDYFSLKEGEIYAFNLLDGAEGISEKKRLIQRFFYDEYDKFTDGRIELNSGNLEGRFQTLRIQKANGNSGPYIGKFLFAFK